MDDSNPTAKDSAGASTAAATTEFAPPEVLFGRYRVRRELGRGGMGVVYLAHDTALGIDVAVKLVPGFIVKDEEALDALRKEVLRGMALQHAGIVRTHNFERDEYGAGIVMEYIEGPTLADVKRQQATGCCGPDQVLGWLAQLCPVLDYAHGEARIVHRDLKPRNIMLTREGRVKIADFGIAATLLDTQARHSKEGASSGTPSYMSPQQARGERPSPLDDIHALGATIYELLTSKPPFFRGSTTSIFGQVLQVIPPSMAERRDELEITGAPAIPDEWERVVATCLAKSAAERPQSGSEILARLKGELVVGKGNVASNVAPVAVESTSAASGAPRGLTGNISISTQAASATNKTRGCMMSISIAFCAMLAVGLWFMLPRESNTGMLAKNETASTPRALAVPPPPHPPTYEQESEAIRQAIAAGNLDAAADVLAKLPSEAPQFADLESLLAAKQKELAVMAERQAKVASLLATVDAAIKAHQWDEARTALAQLVAIDPNSPVANGRLAAIAEEEKKAKAIEEAAALAAEKNRQQQMVAQREAEERERRERIAAMQKAREAVPIAAPPKKAQAKPKPEQPANKAQAKPKPEQTPRRSIVVASPSPAKSTKTPPPTNQTPKPRMSGAPPGG